MARVELERVSKVYPNKFRAIDAGDPDAVDESILREANTVARLDPRSGARAGEVVRIAVDPLRMHFFDPVTGHAIR